jgi:hypothetical protein
VTKILIIGGYGTFGGRLAQLLAAEARLTLLIAGRSRAKAEQFCAALRSSATSTNTSASATVFDRDGDVEAQVRSLAPDIVVDATGPFQSYGADPYRVVKATLACGAHYLDLADGAVFVRGIVQFDGEARSRGRFVLSGVSSLPVLTAAVVRQLAVGMTRLDAVTAGIAPSPYANVGPNVIRAILGYAGKPVALLRDGHKVVGHALIDARRFTIAPPGALPLHSIRFSLVEVPDLEVLPQLWPDLRLMFVGAGPVPALGHRLLSVLAWAVRLRLLPSLAWLTPLIYRAMRRFAWGEHRGGMFVAVDGVGADGEAITRSWHLVAEEDDGPVIPSMAVAAIIRRCLADRPPPLGARAAAGDLELADYEPLFAPRKIVTGTRQEGRSSRRLPLYRRVLGDAWDRLPPQLQTMHELDGALVAEGTATVERGKGVLARLLAAVIGFPQPGSEVPVSVAFSLRDGREYWRRTFAGRSFLSTQEEGQGRFARLVCERFGPVAVGLALVLDGERLRLIVRCWSLFGIPMPLWLAPHSHSWELVQDGRFRFHVEISLPVAGLIVAYRGWLVPRV